MKVKIDSTTKIYPNVQIGEGTEICEYSIIGKPYRPVNGKYDLSPNTTWIGENCYIGSFVIVGQGSCILENSILEDYTQIESDVKIGSSSHLLYAAWICNEVTIGDDCIIGGFVCERARVGNGSRIFGQLTHSQHDPTKSWDSNVEPAPSVSDNVFIGFGAKVIGGITIGNNSYVCAGAIVTRDVPDYKIAYGINKITSHSKWKGTLSRSSQFVRREDGRKPARN